ncbi:uncharacterized protein LOC134075090 isoform X1 [Sardina pilchardus]|uniref:uncharacterized protein LOC134075090 isoform X1 n=1 Tax=Sardina pilchardus TaxID=27697 RepID=UPI002E1181BA
MARSSKSSQNSCNFLLAFLALWSMTSLVVIIVWATWPHMRSLSHCEAARQTAVEKLEGARVVREKDKGRLRDQLSGSRQNQTELRRELGIIMETLRETNVSLMDSLQEKVVLSHFPFKEALKENITTLKSDVEMHMTLQKNLSSVLAWQEAHIDTLQANLSWSLHQWDSCDALISAAKSQQVAAESQNKACKSTTAYISKQLNACRTEDDNGSQQS